MTYLDDILALRRRAVERQKAERPADVVLAAALERRERRDFLGALVSGGRTAIIAEFKRSSPSAGAINTAADPSVVAAAYERGGAAALSVLTEPERFGGSLADLKAARAATLLPVLRKDFIFEQYQIDESVAEGADAVLLIAAALDDVMLARLVARAREMRVAALVEVHEAGEIAWALDAGATIVGINNRNLQTFEVDVTTTLRLRPLIPRGIVVVAESGITSAADVEACAAAGIHAVLVGEVLMRAGDPGAAVAGLRGAVR
jgi:indole-3-glycerol phosphate synthase